MTDGQHMNDSAPPRSAGARRRRFALQSAVLVLAITFACIFAGVIASSRRARAEIDLTGTRQHRLAERTLNVLGALDGEYQIVVAADLRTVDPLAAARTRDVLDAFARASEHVRVRVIDTSAARGIEEFDTLLGDLAHRAEPEIAAQRATIDAAAAVARQVVDNLAQVSATLLSAKGEVKDGYANAALLRQTLEDDAARCRVDAEKLREADKALASILARRIGTTTVPPLDDAAKMLGGAITAASNDLAEVQRREAMVGRASDVAAPIQAAVGPVAVSIRTMREHADGAVESLSRLRVLPIVAVARTLEKSAAALVIGPPGASGKHGSVTAVEFDALFPPRQPQDARAASVDLRSRAEELLSTAIASLGSLEAPIIVLVHDQPVRLGANLDRFSGVVERARLRGMDVVEWAAALDADPPVLTRLDPGGVRPVVYATLSSAASTAEAAMRMKRMVDVQNALVSEGKPVLISVNVSTLPGIGDKDPLTECLAALGVEADTGRPLLRQARTPNGRLVAPDVFTTETVGGSSESANPIARALDGLRCHFTWAVALKAAPGSTGAKFEPIIRVDDSKDVWGESEWLAFAQTSVADRAMVLNPPANDSPRDSAHGPWVVAAAVERPPASGQSKARRAVVVGCAPWFLDDVTQATLGVVDGRPVLQSPGNIELFESCVYWLAGQDEMIARSAAAEAVPIIPTLGASQISLIRWILIAGVPAVVLLIGAAWRLTRG